MLYVTSAVRTHVVPKGAMRRLALRYPGRLTATWWPETDRPLLVAEVEDPVLARLRPWFARQLDDHVEIPRHPDAHVRSGLRQAYLQIGHTRVGRAVTADRGWLAEPSCTVGLLPGGLTSDRWTIGAQFAVLLDLGHALAAEVPIC
ncbi:hypothetical protein AB0H43_17735 [Hamadaea sp. NPDC050747]|uniref:hypothetical protein n=1 Tax=Hamadaea sp. NPDC050747 TaxID=3155789 RepID=UPI0033E11205